MLLLIVSQELRLTIYIFRASVWAVAEAQPDAVNRGNITERVWRIIGLYSGPCVGGGS